MTLSLHSAAAGFVFLTMLVVYLLTVSPTVSFWDSGEFVTTSAIMGIPHPPGSPLMSLVGRVMSIIPFPDLRTMEIGSKAYHVNLINVFCGAFAAMLIYLITASLITRMAVAVQTQRAASLQRRDGIIIFSALAAAFNAGFSHQFWDNSVETETYMPSLLLSLLAFWLTLRWSERKDRPGAVRYLFLAAYLVGLGNGIHLTVLLIAPALLAIVIASKPEWFSSWRFLTSAGAVVVCLMAVKIAVGRPYFYLLMALLALAGPFIAWKYHLFSSDFRFQKDALRFQISDFIRSARVWKTAFLGVFLCLSFFVIGYSVYPTVMVRAAKRPAINEGNPDTWTRYRSYLEREQYTQGNMYLGMFTRSADPGYQFNFMYVRYLLQQLPKWGPSIPVTFTNHLSADYPGQNVPVEEKAFVPIAIWFLILFGIAFHSRRDVKNFSALLLYFLLTSAGLVLYLNMQNPQARERDYFFLGSYMMVMIWLGIGIFGIIQGVHERLEQGRLRRFATPSLVILILVIGTLVPAAALSNHLDPAWSNYKLHNRSRNWIPLDYAVNILQTCAPHAILFTNGDNDTYPLWYAREVEGIRRDVRVVNLSLLNAPWYIKQLRDEDEKIPITFTDDYIDNSLAGNTLQSQQTRLWDPEPKEVTLAGMTWKMPPDAVGALPDGNKAGILSVSSIMVAHIIKTVNWSSPIYFAVSVNPNLMIGLGEHMSMEGMVFRLVRERAADNEYLVNAPVVEKNLFSLNSFRGIADPSLYKPEDTRKLLHNYFIAFARLSEQYIKDGRKEDAIRVARESFRICAPDSEIRMLLYTILRDRGLTDEFNRMIDEEVKHLPLDNAQESAAAGINFINFSMPEAAVRILKAVTDRYRNDPDSWRAYTAALFQAGMYKEALDAAGNILRISPGDSQALEIRQVIEQKLKSEP